MYLNYAELDKFTSQTPKRSLLGKVIGRLLPVMIKIPWYRRYWVTTSAGLYARIRIHSKKADHIKAVQLAVYALTRFRRVNRWCFDARMNRSQWWQFMVCAVDGAHQLDNYDIKESLIDIGTLVDFPKRGYGVAYSYLAYSGWKFQCKEYHEAMRFAHIAAQADPTWAEVDFALGWYSLVLGRGLNGAQAYLESAVQKDHTLLFKIANDNICKQYPSLIRAIRIKTASRCVVGTV